MLIKYIQTYFNYFFNLGWEQKQRQFKEKLEYKM